jgi:hypothetical protein
VKGARREVRRELAEVSRACWTCIAAMRPTLARACPLCTALERIGARWRSSLLGIVRQSVSR